MYNQILDAIELMTVITLPREHIYVGKPKKLLSLPVAHGRAHFSPLVFRYIETRYIKVENFINLLALYVLFMGCCEHLHLCNE